jgi:ABC-2 type transport system ATP-binding protein
VNGRIVQIDSVDNLLQPLQTKHVIQISCDQDIYGVVDELRRDFSHLQFFTPSKATLQVEADQPIKAGALVHFLEEKGVEVSEARKIKPSLEDVFVRITGIEADAMRSEKEKGGGGQ